MFNHRFDKRYAKSLLDLAIERYQLEDVQENVLYLKSLCELSPEFLFMIKSPLIRRTEKKKAVSAVCGGHVNELVIAFLHLLISKNRERYLMQIIKAFLNQYDVIKDRHRAILMTAVPVTDLIKQSFLNKLQAEAKIGNVQLECVLKPELIGGFILEYDGRRIDASLLRGLKGLERQFEKVRIQLKA